MVYSANIPPTGAVVSESPFVRSLDVIAMMADWQVMAAVTRGTNYIRDLSETYLPQEPREDDDAYATRVDRSVLSPYTSRLIETAAGAILRKPIHIEGDEYWLQLAENIDGLGSNINEYARRALVSSLTYGHSAILVDYPQQWEHEILLRNAPKAAAPTSSTLTPPNLGLAPSQHNAWRSSYSSPHPRVHHPPAERLRRRADRANAGDLPRPLRPVHPRRKRCRVHAKRRLQPRPNPLVPIYSNRRGMLRSQPPLLDIANLNITHYQRQADLIHALHIAAMPTLVLEGWDDTTGSATMGVNYAIAMQPGNKAYYVQADATSFDAQMAELQSLEQQMSTLGVTKLFGQKFVAESAEAKRIDQAQSNSVLSIISQELESALNQAFGFAAEYVGIEPPEIHIDRDFDFYRLIGQDIAVLTQLNQLGKISDAMLLEILRRGEILPDDTNIEDAMEAVGRPATEITEPAETVDEPDSPKNPPSLNC